MIHPHSFHYVKFHIYLNFDKLNVNHILVIKIAYFANLPELDNIYCCLTAEFCKDFVQNHQQSITEQKDVR